MRVGKKQRDGCIPWTGRIDACGYGTFGVILAHRASYELFVGPILLGMSVCHRCDNPPCINPTHLFSGTQRDNIADMVRKGRNQRGEKSGWAKLTAPQVSEIRVRYRAEGISSAKLGQEYGVSDQSILSIINHQTWKHVK